VRAKIDIRQFMKRKSISDSRSVENIALHRQQPEKDKQNFDVAPHGKISAGAHWMH